MAANRPLVALAGLAFLICSCEYVHAQQQGSLLVSTESQVIAGSQSRVQGEQSYQPDLGIFWTEPGRRFDQFQLELRVVRRGDAAHLGRTWLALRDVKANGIIWTLQGGALYSSSDFGQYHFSNLLTPFVTFTGAIVSARTTHTTIQLFGGRSNVLRNIFGSDPEQVDQAFGLVRAAYQTTRLELNTRAARTRTGDLQELPKTTDASSQIGGGARIIVTPSLYAVGDGSYVRYRPAGSPVSVQDYSFLVGAHYLLPRGWIETNASRFSPGDFPVLNAPLHDRSGEFVSAEYDVWTRMRLFGGWERVEGNLNPLGVLALQPQTTGDRGFGGVRLQLNRQSSVSLRVEDGGRLSRPVLSAVQPSGTVPQESDSGGYSAEWQTSLNHVTAFGRFAHRRDVDITGGTFRVTQDDASGQVFYNLSRTTQLFGNVTVTHQESLGGNASTFLQVGGGGQQQIFAQGLFLRVEGTAMRNHDLLTGSLVPRNALNIGLNGRLSRQMTIGWSVYLDRTPVPTNPNEQVLLARSTVRLVYSIPTGSVRLPNTSIGSTAGRVSRGTGTIAGTVFADWNGNGEPDPGEEMLPGIPIRLGPVSQVTSARDGAFAFLNVPSGPQQVLLDMHSLPVDFDPPKTSVVDVELGRGDTRRVSFGLVPLGLVRGRVFEDANNNGQIDASDPILDAGVLSLDGGQRSEAVRKGGYRFEAVRAGEHRVSLLLESLPEGAVIVGDAERPAFLAHDRMTVTIDYLVRLEKRPEIRKVFPPKIGTQPGR